jgi:predicted transcriptional regulator
MEHSHSDMTETLITLTSDIVAAHVSNNSVSATELSSLIGSVYGALAALGQSAPLAESAPAKPAVSIRASVKPEYVTCLDCGMELKMLKRHLMTHHQMTPDLYRSRWSLPSDHPLVAPLYAEKRRNLAMSIGLGRKPGVKRGRKPKA